MRSRLGEWRSVFVSMSILTRLMLAAMFFCFAAFIYPSNFNDHPKGTRGLSQYNCVNYSDASKSNTNRDAPNNQSNSNCKGSHCLITTFSEVKTSHIGAYLDTSFHIQILTPSVDADQSRKLNLVSAPRGPPKVLVLG